MIFQLRALFGHQSFSPGMLTSQIKIIGVPCPVIKKSMASMTTLIEQIIAQSR